MILGNDAYRGSVDDAENKHYKKYDTLAEGHAHTIESKEFN